MVQRLLAARAIVDSSPGLVNGQTALQAAEKGRHEAVVELLTQFLGNRSPEPRPPTFNNFRQLTPF